MFLAARDGDFATVDPTLEQLLSRAPSGITRYPLGGPRRWPPCISDCAEVSARGSLTATVGAIKAGESFVGSVYALYVAGGVLVEKETGRLPAPDQPGMLCFRAGGARCGT